MARGARWEATGPHSVSSAIDAAALLAARHEFATQPAPHCYADKPEIRAADLSEEAHARLSGFLYLTGQARRRTSIADICDQVISREDSRLRGHRTQAEAVAALTYAADILGALTAFGGLMEQAAQPVTTGGDAA